LFIYKITIFQKIYIPTDMNENSNLIGKRVRIIRLEDPYTKLKSGDEGKISYIDDMGSIFVDWDSGSKLALLPDIDEYEILDTQVQSQIEGVIYKFSQFYRINEDISQDINYLKEKMIEFSELFSGLESKFDWEMQDDDIVVKVRYTSDELDLDYYYEWVINIDENREEGLVRIHKLFSTNLEDLDDEFEELYFSGIEEAVGFIQDELKLYIQHNESVGYSFLLEKNIPLNPSLWNSCKSWAKSRYEVWPSAYAVGAAAKRYKEKGGRWKKGKKKSRSKK
jgi:hypothetical protein